MRAASSSCLPQSTESTWSLAIRGKGSRQPYALLKPRSSDFGDSGSIVFHAKATNLLPDTPYEYVLSTSRNRVKEGWFRTAPRVMRRPVRFIVGGDMGTKAAIPMCKRAGKESPLFVAVGGDLAYANGRAAPLWYDWIDNWTNLVVAPDGRSIPIVVAIGNHEMKSFSGLRKRELWKGLFHLRPNKAGAPLFFSLFDLPGDSTNYVVDFSNYMSLVVLDSGHAQAPARQTAWLDAVLTQRQRTPHLFAMYHEPAWGTGIKPNNWDVQRYWTPLFEKHQVDCVFENDHHCYKRTHPITRGRRDPARGIYYLGDGAWGATLRPITQDMLRQVGAQHYLAAWRSVHHAILVSVQPDGRRSYKAIQSDGSVFDQMSDAKVRRPIVAPARVR